MEWLGPLGPETQGASGTCKTSQTERKAWEGRAFSSPNPWSAAKQGDPERGTSMPEAVASSVEVVLRGEHEDEDWTKRASQQRTHPLGHNTEHMERHSTERGPQHSATAETPAGALPDRVKRAKTIRTASGRRESQLR